VVDPEVKGLLPVFGNNNQGQSKPTTGIPNS